MLRIPLPEYADGTLRKLTASLSLYPLVSSVPLSLHTRRPYKAPHMLGKRKVVIAGPLGHCVRDERSLQDCGACGKYTGSAAAKPLNSSFIIHHW